jgi:hypothetical protein
LPKITIFRVIIPSPVGHGTIVHREHATYKELIEGQPERASHCVRYVQTERFVHSHDRSEEVVARDLRDIRGKLGAEQTRVVYVGNVARD